MNSFDPMATVLDHDQSLHTRQFAGDDKLFVQFYEHFVQDVIESTANARPIYNSATFIKIVTPGDRDNIIERPVTDQDKFRFAQKWERYKKGQENIEKGTRLEEWSLVARSMCEELKFLGFYTVEQVSEATDSAMDRVPGMRELKSRAKAWLKVAEDAEAVVKTQAANEAKDAEIKFLQKQIDELKQLAAQVKIAEDAVDLKDLKKNSTKN